MGIHTSPLVRTRAACSSFVVGSLPPRPSAAVRATHQPTLPGITAKPYIGGGGFGALPGGKGGGGEAADALQVSIVWRPHLDCFLHWPPPQLSKFQPPGQSASVGIFACPWIAQENTRVEPGSNVKAVSTQQMLRAASC